MGDLLLIMPEIFISLTLLCVVAGEVSYFGEHKRLITPIALVGLGSALIQILIAYQSSTSLIFHGVMSVDGFSLFFKILFVMNAVLTIASGSYKKAIGEERRTEFIALILGATLAMCVAASAADLALIFLSLLFLNVISYFLSAFGRKSVVSAESAVKGLAFGAVVGALFLYALAILFSAARSLNIYEIHRNLINHPLPPQVMLVVFIFVFLAFAYQMSAFPMHFVAPDVLEGAPTPVSAFLAIGFRSAGFAVATRFLIVTFSQPGILRGRWQVLGEIDWTEILSVAAALTMILGSLLAYRQNTAKRLVSYLVVAGSGYLLMGLLVLDEVGLSALLYNLVVELFALLGSYFVISFLVDELGTDLFAELKGALRRCPAESLSLIAFLFTLIGVPPMPGFIGKFALIGVAIRHHRVALASAAVFSMVVCAVAVFRLVFALVGDFQTKLDLPIQESVSRRLFLAALLGPLAMIGVFSDIVLKWAGQSLGFIFW